MSLMNCLSPVPW